NGNNVTETARAPKYTIRTDGEGSTTSINNSSGAPTQTTTITGRLLATNQGATNIGLGSQISKFTGSTDDGAFYQNPASSSSSAFGNGLTESSGTTQTNAGQISIYAANGSTWEVQPNPVSLAGEVQGVMNKWSNLSLYDSNGFSIVDLTTPGTTPNAGQDLNIVQLQGNGAAFKLRTYVDENSPVHGGEINGEDTSQIRDHVNILSGTGQHYIVLPSSGRGAATPNPQAQRDYLVWVKDSENTVHIKDPFTGETVEEPGDNNLSFKLGIIQDNQITPSLKVDIGLYNYYLATRDMENDENTGDDSYNKDGTEFYLVRGEEYVPEPEPEPDPDPDPTPDPEPEPEPGPTPTPDPEPEYSPSTDVLRELAGFGAQYAIWWADLSDLRKRLGEVRYGAQDGAWARVITQKDNVSGVGYGGFTQKLYAVNIGIDHFAVQDKDRMWMLGGNFKYPNGNHRVKRSEYGKGDVHSWDANLYATYANQYGCYSDFVLTYDHYQSKLHTRMLDDTPVGAKWNNYGYGASLEVGKMFSSTQNDEGWGPWYNHWWIEPQAQLAYYRIHGRSFTLSNGMKADPHNIDFLTGRLGVVIGKKFNYGKDRAIVDKRYSQFYIKGGIKHEFLGKQRLTVSDTVNEVTFKGDFRGTRVYYGGGFDWNFTDQLRLYAQIERENGGKYKKDYEISVGLKWQF
ncbi:MAG: autotransporter outer membrane beta-barrel domain-containing protein, partial [Parabacteroides sp.]|nr:autotransporter outer membrane beta-barrel domain-containing protein [Parabacteroides sp.]